MVLCVFDMKPSPPVVQGLAETVQRKSGVFLWLSNITYFCKTNKHCNTPRKRDRDMNSIQRKKTSGQTEQDISRAWADTRGKRSVLCAAWPFFFFFHIANKVRTLFRSHKEHNEQIFADFTCILPDQRYRGHPREQPRRRSCTVCDKNLLAKRRQAKHTT